MHPLSGAIVPKHPPVGPDLLALDLHDQDVVKIKAELPQFGDHHDGKLVRTQRRFFHLITSVSAAQIAHVRRGHVTASLRDSVSSGQRMDALRYSAMSARETGLRR